MEPLLIAEIEKLQNALVQYWNDDKIYLSYTLEPEDDGVTEAYIYINYGRGEEKIDVELTADISLNDDGTIDIFYKRMYGPMPDGFIILSSDIDGIENNDIIDNYPHDTIVDKIKVMRQYKLMKNALFTISTQLLGYEIEDPRQLSNALISKFRKCI